ncbi:MAG TPA: nucleotidyl transferase AbiEii/AbiGii toxin family protein [Candidatus Binataceae bacterium]|nr:nucleotidyl transferase AbiEii/AbiGii toxin family protein [Candidatus Binataceae bacterium]
MDLDFASIRRLIITALFANDKLLEKLVLKGGNALSLVYEISPRTSLDLDFSIQDDFEDPEEIQNIILRTLQDRFDAAGYVVFDLALTAKPRLDHPDEMPWWGGYELTFKITQKEKHQRLQNRLDKLRIDALVIGPNQQRTFRVDLSKHEYTEGKVAKDIDYYDYFKRDAKDP